MSFILNNDELESMLPAIFNNFKYENNMYSFYNKNNEDFFYADLKLGLHNNTPCLYWIGVSRRLRGKGVGNYLMNSLIGVLKDRGYCKLNIIQPFKESLSFYERFGLVKNSGNCFIKF